MGRSGIVRGVPETSVKTELELVKIDARMWYLCNGTLFSERARGEAHMVPTRTCEAASCSAWRYKPNTRLTATKMKNIMSTIAATLDSAANREQSPPADSC